MCLMEREGERGREGGREGEETKMPRLVRLKTMMKLYVDRKPLLKGIESLNVEKEEKMK